ncbi:MAG: undecaprenyldiphospho-muramoylpentapeptide beta-N-acetylglucosaminyltransferase [Bacteroidota bacterium]|nr:undecaprenyldiphospho-muramoylpentapeptide beta-N-acetylglucosaminyltransferase [Bacteroidota bacterium]
MSSIRVILAGGGTGGHLFPAIAIADEIKKIEPKSEILFIGTKGKIESQVVPQTGYQFATIWISGFHRDMRIKNLLFPLKVIVSMIQAYTIIKQFKPDVVIGTGGYVSGPILRMAAYLKVPSLIHEQNSYPGVTTRLLAPKVNEVHLTFESSKKYFPALENVFITGNPTRQNLENVNQKDAYEFFGFEAENKSKTILVFGGSLGAAAINRAVERWLDELMKKNLRLIWQTGAEEEMRAKEKAAKYPRNQIWVSSFIHRMDYAYFVSDLVICRAGATTIAELTRLGKPAILVPYPHAAANHQAENAVSLAQSGAAKIISDDEVEEKLFNEITQVLDDSILARMSEQSKKIGKPNAASDIAQRVIQLSKVYGRK